MSAGVPFLERGQQAQREGRLAEAEHQYRARLQEQPNDAAAWHLLGGLFYQQGRADEALAALERAAALDPAQPDVHNILGVIRTNRGELDAAVARFELALLLQPQAAEVHNNLGSALHAQGRTVDAIASFEKAVHLRADYAGAWHNLGLAQNSLGRCTDAVASFRHALEVRPDHGATHGSLGTALMQLGDLDAAQACYHRALQLRPRDPIAHFNLGNLWLQRQNHEQAIASYLHALEIRPNYARAHYNLGKALEAIGGRDAEALASYQQAVRFDPTFCDALCCLGNLGLRLNAFELARASCEALERLDPPNDGAQVNLGWMNLEDGNITAAAARFARALELNPGCALAHFNAANLHLLQGDYERAWPGYEWRRQLGDLCKFDPPVAPRWDGTPLAGRTLLLRDEQGYGDTIQFLRYASLIRGGRLVIECSPKLLRLVAQSGLADTVVSSAGPLPSVDVELPLPSAPALFGTTLATIPSADRYLQAPPELVATWRSRLHALPGLRVGIAWQGNPYHRRDRQRSVPATMFAPLALPGIMLVSLQVGPGAEQHAALAEQVPLHNPGLSAEADFAETAAVLDSLDLVITVDTALAHLGGALGVPTWVAVTAVPDWRWLLGRDESPWYASVRLFRQSQRGEWGDVFTRIRDGLRALVDPSQQTQP